jgi:hypothetical protein
MSLRGGGDKGKDIFMLFNASLESAADADIANTRNCHHSATTRMEEEGE